MPSAALSLFAALILVSPLLPPSDRDRMALRGPVKTMREFHQRSAGREGGAAESLKLQIHTYTFDRRGFLTSETEFDEGYESALVAITYDPSGIRTLKVTEQPRPAGAPASPYGSGGGAAQAKATQDLETVYRDIFRVDERGRVTEESQQGSDGSVVRTQRFWYNAAGRLTRSAWISTAGAEYSALEYRYDSKGNLHELLDASGVIGRYSHYRYDQRGNWVERVCFSPDWTIAEAGPRTLSVRRVESRVLTYY